MCLTAYSVCLTAYSVCLTAYISLCRGLKYLLKVRYIILNYPSVARFLIFESLCLGSSKTLPYVWKKFHKNDRHLSFVTHNFTKLSQIVCLINVHNMPSVTAGCGRFSYSIAFFGILSHITACLTRKPIIHGYVSIFSANWFLSIKYSNMTYLDLIKVQWLSFKIWYRL